MRPSPIHLLRTTSLGRRLKTPVRAALFRAGYEIVPVGSDMEVYVASVLRRLEIASVLDVGANQGQYGTWLRRIGFAGSIASFEPMAEPYGILARLAAKDARWSAHHLAAGAERSALDMHVSANSVSSSLLAPTAEQVAAAPESAQVRTERVDVRPLDDVVAELGVTGPTWLKIDTQGYESQVLAGASALLSSAAAVQCEVSLVELYEGQDDYLSVLRTLRDAGFRLVRAEPAFVDPHTGDALQLDVLMVKG